MTDSPKSENSSLDPLSSAQVSPLLSPKLWRRGAIGLGFVLVVGTAGAISWLWFFVNNDLGPLVEKELGKLIDRPVKIGPIEEFYLTGLRVGASAIPTTETDPDFVEIPTVKVGFDPLMLLFRRTLNLKISLLQPTIYIEQDIKNTWLDLNLKKSSASQKTVNINIKTVEITNGQVILAPNGTRRAQLFDLEEPMVLPPVLLENVQAKARFFNQQKETRYHVTAQPKSGGNLTINGHSNLSSLATKLDVEGKNLDGANIIPLIANLPVRVDQGKLNCDLKLNLAETTVTAWRGNANFEKVNGQLGTLDQPISQASGQVKFSDLRIALQKTEAIYGELPLKVTGTIDTKSDYDLAISIPSLSLANYINTLELNLPVPVTGAASTELQVTGPLLNPILSGMVVATEPGKVDLIEVGAASARFRMEGEELAITDIQLKPILGGFIYGRGNIQLTEIPQLGFYLLGENLPGDAIAQLYRGEKPPFAIGRIHGNTRILGQADQPTALVKWRSPEMKYPGSGELTITQDTILLNNSVFQVGGGTVNAIGAIMPTKDRWQAFLRAQNIELNQLTSSTTNPGENNSPENNSPENPNPENNSPENPNPENNIPENPNPENPNPENPNPENTAPAYPAILAGGLRLSGKLTSLTPANIQGSGEVELTTLDAKVTGRGTLDKGKWLASLGVQTLPGKALRLNQLIPDLPIPMELGSGTLELSGTVDSFDSKKIDPKKIDAKGTLKVNLPETGIVTASANLQQGQVTARATLTNAEGRSLSLNPRTSFWTPLRSASVSLTEGNLELSGAIDPLFDHFFSAKVSPAKLSDRILNTWSFHSTIQLLIAGAAVTGKGRLEQGEIELSAILNSDNLLSLNPWKPDLPVPLELTAGSLELSGSIAPILSGDKPVSDILNSWSGHSTIQLLIAGAAVTGKGRLKQGQLELSAILNYDNFLSLNAWKPDLPVPLGVTAGNVELSGKIDSLLAQFYAGNGDINFRGLNTWSGRGNVQLNLAGNAIASQGSFMGDRWQVSLNAENLNLNSLAPKTRSLPEPVTATGSVNLSGFLTSFSPQDIQAEGEFTLVNQLSLNYSQSSGLSQLFPLYSEWGWNGEVLQIKQAKAPGLSLDGELFVQWQNQRPTVSKFDLNLQVNQFNLAALPLPLNVGKTPEHLTLESSGNLENKISPILPFMPLAIAGLLDFNGRLRGQINPSFFNHESQTIPELLLNSQIWIAGDLQVQNLAVNDWQFASSLSGKVNLDTHQSLQVNLEGDNTQIALAINNPIYQNISTWSANGLVNNAETILSANLAQQQLSIAVENFPLSRLNIAPAPAYYYNSVGGILNGNFNLNLATFLGNGKIAIAHPAVGNFFMDQITAEIYSDRGKIAISNAILKMNQSEYRLDAQFSANPKSEIHGQLTINQGNISDALAAMRWFTTDDLKRGLLPPNYGNQDSLKTASAGLPEATLYQQLSRFAEIKAKLLQIAMERQQAAFPKLVDIRGLVNGEIRFKGSLAAGINASLNLVANNLEWRSQPSYAMPTPEGLERLDNRVINIDRVIFQGSFQDGHLIAQPLRVEQEATLISYVGTIFGENQSGQLQIRNLSGEDIRNFIDVPGYRVDGLLDLTANLAGNWQNLQARGEISFSDVRLNGEKLANIKGGFNYGNSRLAISTIEPNNLQIFTNLPVPPFPGNEQFSLNVNIKNEGLTLANILTGQQVTWVDGNGELKLQVEGKLNSDQGTLTDITANGSAIASNATINAQALPEPLTNLNGRVFFNENLIFVEGIDGQFSQGNILAQGFLPIFRPLSRNEINLFRTGKFAAMLRQAQGENSDETLRANQPEILDYLRLELEGVEINFKDLYRGGVVGQLQITGTGFSPQIGGKITLSDGIVLLPDSSEIAPNRPLLEEIQVFTPQYKNLQLTLGENIRIANPPLLEFIGSGDLLVNGFFEDLKPAGIIRLKEGEVNLFATQFRLIDGYEHFAEFTGDLDPNIEVRLVTSVPEVTRREFSATSASEIREAVNTGIGELRTVRVEAVVSGRSSQIYNTAVELKSNPARDEAEIVALIGGGFANTLGRGDSPLAIANLAGSTVLKNVQTEIGDAFGLSEFRLLPVMVQSGGNTRLALEVEAGVDLGRQFSFSVLWPKLFLDNENTRYNIRYRFNDRLLLRGSTDFQGDTRARIDYEFRF
ncbi:translocation/assembly module TamB domain-containing protein [Planktothricoides raciborskii]|uniref:Translocation/assembly module TamB domain-containing protein n=1 Tax=Planktothricoides raciborskii GIHE-MW2 TaxID=2792601 RepID=A0AAU8JDJ2_9CYAN